MDNFQQSIKLAFELNYRFKKNHAFPFCEFQIVFHLQFERSMAYTVCHAPLES